MADQSPDKKKPAAERTRQVGVSFPVDQMIADQLADEQQEKARRQQARAKPQAPPVERSRSEVYGMPVDTIIAHANAAYPPLDDAPEDKPEEPVWTSIEDQMANPLGRKARGPKGKLPR